ncbi:MAG: hypothetical protein NC036_01760 [Muribaculaceae bacterium]|nr:hypothetical protein [Muribaculaceae bacterium]
MATHPQEDTGSSIFRLSVFCLPPTVEPEYPSFGVDETVVYFNSREEAVSRMTELAGSEQIYCFQIARLPLGQEMNPDSYSNLWLYNEEGELLDRSFVSSIYHEGQGLGYAPFFGRPKAYTRFKKGDIIEYLSGHYEVKVGIILYQHITFEDIWERTHKYWEAGGKEPLPMFADYSDDIYLVIDEDYKCWGYDINVQSTSILPLSVPISDELREKLEAKYRWAAEGN